MRLINYTTGGIREKGKVKLVTEPSAHLNAVYNSFDFSGPLAFVKQAAGLSDRVMDQ